MGLLGSNGLAASVVGVVDATACAFGFGDASLFDEPHAAPAIVSPKTPTINVAFRISPAMRDSQSLARSGPGYGTSAQKSLRGIISPPSTIGPIPGEARWPISPSKLRCTTSPSVSARPQ